MSIQVSRILHAAYIFETAKTRILFDPIFENPFSVNCYAYPDVSFDLESIKKEKFDAIFISHFHEDHFSLPSLDLLPRSTPIYLFCQEESFFSLLNQLGFKSVFRIKLKESLLIGDFKVTAHRALNEDIDSIFHIQSQNFNILNVVDSWIHPDSLELFTPMKWDLILWPFQCMQEVEVLAPSMICDKKPLLPAEWKEQLSILNPRYVVPSSCQLIQESWSWLRGAYFPISYEEFRNWLNAFLPHTQILRIEPGRSLLMNQQEKETRIQKADSLSWITINSEEQPDYIYNPEPQTVVSISKHFPALNFEQKLRLHRYCTNSLRETFVVIGASQDFYFNKKRIWKLALYDSGEKLSEYYFILKEENLIPTKAQAHDWLTEIPAYKLFQAAFFGEPLTSLYLQINSEPLSDSKKSHLQQVDPLEDPLVRILSARPLASFQEIQLKKILLMRESSSG